MQFSVIVILMLLLMLYLKVFLWLLALTDLESLLLKIQFFSKTSPALILFRLNLSFASSVTYLEIESCPLFSKFLIGLYNTH